MKIIRLSKNNLRPLEDELDRIGFKHGIEPHSIYLPSPRFPFGPEDINGPIEDVLDWGDPDDE